MILTTDRLILRPWREDDAAALFEYAKDPEVGPIAGWPVHPDIEYSKKAIAEYLSGEGIFAVVLKGTDSPIGSIGVLVGKTSNFDIEDDEGEIGYWIGVPYWGQGLIPEAMHEIVRYSFEELGLTKLWCGYFDGNEKSMRVQKKCGFAFHHTEKDKKVELIDAVKTEHITCMTRDEWIARSADVFANHDEAMKLEKLWESVKGEETALLATSADEGVTMRTVSLVCYQDAILIFTCSKSQKYQQMKSNPHCCVAVGGYFIEAKPEFLGHTMLDENAHLRKVYSEKFADAFDESTVNGGRESEFVLLKPIRVKSWCIENGVSTGPFEHEFR